MSKYRTSNKKSGVESPPATSPPRARANQIHSLLTSLPVIMLLAGLGYYYHSENRQQTGALILDQSVSIEGRYQGTSAQSSRRNAQRILWLRSLSGLRGYRVSADQLPALEQLEEDTVINIVAAPRVADSKVLWVYRLSTAQGELLSPSVGDTREQPVLVGDENPHEQ